MGKKNLFVKTLWKCADTVWRGSFKKSVSARQRGWMSRSYWDLEIPFPSHSVIHPLWYFTPLNFWFSVYVLHCWCLTIKLSSEFDVLFSQVFTFLFFCIVWSRCRQYQVLRSGSELNQPKLFGIKSNHSFEEKINLCNAGKLPKILNCFLRGLAKFVKLAIAPSPAPLSGSRKNWDKSHCCFSVIQAFASVI